MIVTLNVTARLVCYGKGMERNIGYCRVSSLDQDLSVQKAALERHGCHLIFEETTTGPKREGREKLDLALKVIAEGDHLVVTRLDRLGRSLRDLANSVTWWRSIMA